MSRERGEFSPPITLKQALIDTTFKPGRVYVGPDEIDLATLQPDLEELIDYTLGDPRNREAGRIVYVDGSDRVTTNKSMIVGMEKQVYLTHSVMALTVPIPGLNRRYQQNRFVGGNMHSHPIDQLPSPVDLEHLMVKDEDPMASTSVLLITPARKVAVFRGDGTPHWTREQSQEKTRVLTDALFKRAQKFSNLLTSQETTHHFSILAVRAMFRQFATKYGLQVFEGGVRDGLLRRVPADQAGELIP